MKTSSRNSHLAHILATLAFAAMPTMGATVINQFNGTVGWDLDGWTINTDVDNNNVHLTFRIAGPGITNITEGDLRVHRELNGTGDRNVGTMTRYFDTTGFTDVTLTLKMYQPNGSTWEGDELFQIFVDTGSGFTSVYSNGSRLEGGNGTATGAMQTIVLGSNVVNMDNIANLGVQLWFNPGHWAATGSSPEEYVLRDVTFTGIPEPSSALIGILGILGLLRRRR